MQALSSHWINRSRIRAGLGCRRCAAPAAPPLVPRPLQGAHPALRVRAAAAGDALSGIEALRRELDDLEAELRQASETGEVCARRSRRLRKRSSQLSEYALEKVLAGDEDAARSALRIKASVRDALDNATQRAAANAALAAKLEAVIESKQLQLLQRIREARADIERRRGAEGRGAGAGGAAEEGVRELRRASSSGGRRRGDGEGGGGAQWGGS